MTRTTAPAPADRVANAGQVIQLLREARSASLATLDEQTGSPFASLVNVAISDRGEPLLLISALARHTMNLTSNGAASLLIAGHAAPDADPLTGPRLTIIGRFVQLATPAEVENARTAYLAQHPAAQGYASFADFSWWRMVAEEVHFVGGFGRIDTIPASLVWAAWRD